MVLARPPSHPQDARPTADDQTTSQDAGCDLGKRSPMTPLLKLQLSVLMYMTVAERINTRVMLPFIVQLIEETGVTGGDITKVGYYTGLVEAIANLAEGVLILQWGWLSDHIGRRPVLFMSMLGLCISTTCLGLSHSLWAIIASRALHGAMNSNKGTVRTVIGEIMDASNIDWGFALIPPAWSVGNTVSPLIGGMLQHPYERFGGVFRRAEFWRINPYFLPCFVTVVITLLALVSGVLFLQETLPRRSFTARQGAQCTRSSNEIDDSDEATERSPLMLARPPSHHSTRYGLLTPRVLLITLIWSLFACIDVSFDVLQPLILSTPIAHGGLGMSPAVIGTCLAGFGIVKGASSVLFFPWLFRTVGARRLNTVCIAALLGCFLLFPAMNALARREGEITRVVWAAYFLQLTLAALPNMAYSCQYIYITAAAPPGALGATNGFTQSMASFMRCLGPAGATALYALSIQHNLLGGNLIYVVMCSIVSVVVATSGLLPDQPWCD